MEAVKAQERLLLLGIVNSPTKSIVSSIIPMGSMKSQKNEEEMIADKENRDDHTKINRGTPRTVEKL